MSLWAVMHYTWAKTYLLSQNWKGYLEIAMAWLYSFEIISHAKCKYDNENLKSEIFQKSFEKLYPLFALLIHFERVKGACSNFSE